MGRTPPFSVLRIRRRKEFEQVLRGGLRAQDGLLTVWAAPNGRSVTRLGLVVGQRHGKAVRRNRLKRIVREAFRLSYAQLPSGLDILVAPRPGCELELTATQSALTGLIARLARRLRGAEAAGA